MKSDFIQRYRHRLAGLALFGMASERNDGPNTRASKVFEIPGEVERLLGELYDSAQPKSADADVFLAEWAKLTLAEQEDVKAKFRAAWTKPETKVSNGQK